MSAHLPKLSQVSVHMTGKQCLFCKTMNMTNQQNNPAPSKGSDQSEHPPCLIKTFAVRIMVAYNPNHLRIRLWMSRLIIGVFTVRTCNFVGFDVLPLISQIIICNLEKSHSLINFFFRSQTQSDTNNHKLVMRMQRRKFPYQSKTSIPTHYYVTRGLYNKYYVIRLVIFLLYCII